MLDYFYIREEARMQKGTQGLLENREEQYDHFFTNNESTDEKINTDDMWLEQPYAQKIVDSTTTSTSIESSIPEGYKAL